MILRLWLLVVLTLAGAFAPSRAQARGAENRTWDFFPANAETRQETAPQVADSHLANPLHGYETASGCCLAAERTAARTFNPANFADDVARIRAESAARYGPGEGITAMAKPFSGNQTALVDLAKQAQRTGGVSAQEAQTLRQWAQEYGLPFRGPEVHPNRPFGQFPHIHVGPVNHLPVK